MLSVYATRSQHVATRFFFCELRQSANEYSMHSHAMPLSGFVRATQIPLDVFGVHRRRFENAHSGGAKHPKIVKCLRKDRQNLISTQFDSTCLYSSKVSSARSNTESRRVCVVSARCARRNEGRLKAALRCYCRRAQKPLRSSFDAFKLFTLRPPTQTASRVSFCSCDTQL